MSTRGFFFLLSDRGCSPDRDRHCGNHQGPFERTFHWFPSVKNNIASVRTNIVRKHTPPELFRQDPWFAQRQLCTAIKTSANFSFLPPESCYAICRMEILPILPTIAAAFAGSARQRRMMRRPSACIHVTELAH
jgi:hypothetical protein